jgi:hypothetical protein
MCVTREGIRLELRRAIGGCRSARELEKRHTYHFLYPYIFSFGFLNNFISFDKKITSEYTEVSQVLPQFPQTAQPKKEWWRVKGGRAVRYSPLYLISNGAARESYITTRKIKGHIKLFTIRLVLLHSLNMWFIRLITMYYTTNPLTSTVGLPDKIRRQLHLPPLPVVNLHGNTLLLGALGAGLSFKEFSLFFSFASDRTLSRSGGWAI